MTDIWRHANRANWDERVAIHLASEMYDQTALRAGDSRLDPLIDAELGDVAGLRVAHLQCHFGMDTLRLALRGADVVGVDFSAPAIIAARNLAAELGVAAQFVEADLYAAPTALTDHARFDLVYVTWGALPWLPDIAGWAQVVAALLKPGGALYLAEGHPIAWAYDDKAADAVGRPGLMLPYFEHDAYIEDDETDYAAPTARLQNTRTHQFLHRLDAVISALVTAGLAIEFLHEHPRVAWQMFRCLEQCADGMWHWPDRPWLPLSYSLRARRSLATSSTPDAKIVPAPIHTGKVGTSPKIR